MLPMHARETEFKQPDVVSKATFFWHSIRGVLWQAGVTVSLVEAAHYVSKLVSELMFTW